MTVKAPLDSGGSESLVTKKFVKKPRLKRSGDSNAVWTTPGGEMHAKEPMWFATRSGPPIWMCAVLFGVSVVRFLDSAVESKFFFSA